MDINRQEADKARRGGFTIIEVMIALAIFAIGFLAVAAMQIDAVRRASHARDVTTAQELAKLEMEFLQGLPFYDATADLDGNGAVEPFDMHPALLVGQHVENGAWTGAYTIRWTVVDDVPIPAILNTFLPPPPNMVTVSKIITVTVTPDTDAGNVMATIQMIKMWERDSL